MDSVTELKPNIIESKTLNWSDYSIFIAMLGFSSIIGIYFGFFVKKVKSTDEYLLGGKNMKPIPIGWSLVASSISGVTFIAIPAEVYSTKATYWLSALSLVLACPIAYYFFIKVMKDLNVTSTYEYLELRFNRKIRLFTSWFNNITYIFSLPIVIYIPALTMNQVTGINLYVISAIITAICVFYTMFGGMKAVVWTDFFQLSIMTIAFLTILIVGTFNAGGISKVLKTSFDDGKLDIFELDFNIFQRSTFVSIFFGAMIAQIIGIGTGQSFVQRYLSLSNKKSDLKIAILIMVVGIGLYITFGAYSGILVYATYYGCDPISQKLVSKTDQIFPYYILDKIGHIPALPGLFVAGVFSASLSTLSTSLNSLACIIYEDNLKNRGYDANKAYIIMQSIILVIGIISVLMIFVIQNMGKILSVMFILNSITAAPVCCLYVMGMLIPISNVKGAIAGSVSSSLLLGWIAIGSTIYKVNFAAKNIYPESENTCPINDLTNSTAPTNSMEDDEVFFIYKLSYMMYTTVGLFVGIVIGTITSYITGPTDSSTIDPLLISPPLRRFLPKKKEYCMEEIKLNDMYK